MRRGQWIVLVLVLVPFLSGCIWSNIEGLTTANTTIRFKDVPLPDGQIEAFILRKWKETIGTEGFTGTKYNCPGMVDLKMGDCKPIHHTDGASQPFAESVGGAGAAVGAGYGVTGSDSTNVSATGGSGGAGGAGGTGLGVGIGIGGEGGKAIIKSPPPPRGKKH